MKFRKRVPCSVIRFRISSAVRSFSAKMTGECPLRKQANDDDSPLPPEIPHADGSEEVVA